MSIHCQGLSKEGGEEAEEGRKGTKEHILWKVFFKEGAGPPAEEREGTREQ